MNESKDNTRQSHDEADLPPPPAEPDPGECCGRGCERCVYVYYEEALERWREKVAAIRAQRPASSS